MFPIKKIHIKSLCKIIVIVFLLVMNVGLVYATKSMIYEKLTWDNIYSEVTWCERYQNEGRYNDLRENLILYDSYDEMFDPYWEIADAYQALMDYNVWHKTIKELDTNNAEYNLLLENSRQKIKEIAKNSSFEKNRPTLNYFLKQTEIN